MLLFVDGMLSILCVDQLQQAWSRLYCPVPKVYSNFELYRAASTQQAQDFTGWFLKLKICLWNFCGNLKRHLFAFLLITAPFRFIAIARRTARAALVTERIKELLNRKAAHLAHRRDALDARAMDAYGDAVELEVVSAEVAVVAFVFARVVVQDVFVHFRYGGVFGHAAPDGGEQGCGRVAFGGVSDFVEFSVGGCEGDASQFLHGEASVVLYEERVQFRDEAVTAAKHCERMAVGVGLLYSPFWNLTI